MPSVKYTPKADARVIAPGLKPGQVLEVSSGEAERLLATGQFTGVRAASGPQPSRKASARTKSRATPPPPATAATAPAEVEPVQNGSDA